MRPPRPTLILAAAAVMAASLGSVAHADAPPRLVALDANGGCVVLGDSDVRCFGLSPVSVQGAGMARIVGIPARVESIVATGGLGCVLTAGHELFCFGERHRDELDDELPRLRAACERDTDYSRIEQCTAAVDALAEAAPFTARRIAGDVAGVALAIDAICHIEQRSGVVRCRSLAERGEPVSPIAHVSWNARANGRAVRVAIGDTHACATNEAGQVHCWGNPEHAGVGRAGSARSLRRPVRVDGIEGATDVACSVTGGCARTSAGTLRCWGEASRSDYVAAAGGDGMLDVAAIAGTWTHLCASRSDGRVFCWGPNTQGELGVGDLVAHASPVEVPALRGATALAVDLHGTCGVVGAEVRCAGNARHRRFGSYADLEYPSFLPMLESNGVPARARSFGVGLSTSCLRGDDGRWRCTAIHPPTGSVVLAPAFEGATDVETVRGGCILRSNGEARCGTRSISDVAWVTSAGGPFTVRLRDGRILSGQDPSREPSVIDLGIPDARELVALDDLVCGLDRNGGVRCATAAAPSFVPGAFEGGGFERLVGGGRRVCARTGSAAHRCAPQDGLRTRHRGGATEVGPANTAGFSVFFDSFCALDASRTLTCRRGSATATLTQVTAFESVGVHTCARRVDGSIHCRSDDNAPWATGAIRYLFTTPRPMEIR
ncbi:MAG: hypothetical protein IPI43_33440 [Sandaracinaceae bacterium]|nr:hypothetical protein [Sandaracinaceae bacterium]